MASGTMNIGFDPKLYDTGRYLRMRTVNYDSSITLGDGYPSGNSAGIVLVSEGGSDISLWAFSYRPQNERVSIQKIGGNNSATLTATVTTNGVITINSSVPQQMTVYYSAHI